MMHFLVQFHFIRESGKPEFRHVFAMDVVEAVRICLECLGSDCIVIDNITVEESL